jgi:hypothetical protein
MCPPRRAARQVRATARREAAVIVGLGVGFGAVIALVTLVPLTGSPVPYAPAGLLALVLGSAAAVGFGGSELAVRLAVRAHPAAAIAAGD